MKPVDNYKLLSLSDAADHVLKPENLIQTKINGHRIRILIDNGQVRILNKSNSSSQHENSTKILLGDFDFGDGLVDAEYIPTLKQLYVFDYHQGSLDYIDRVELYTEFITDLGSSSIRPVQTSVSYRQKKSMLQFLYDNQDVFEGFVIKNKYTGQGYKVKFWKTIDLKVIQTNVDNKQVFEAIDDDGTIHRIKQNKQVKVNDIVEIRYLAASKNRLINPVQL